MSTHHTDPPLAVLLDQHHSDDKEDKVALLTYTVVQPWRRVRVDKPKWTDRDSVPMRVAGLCWGAAYCLVIYLFMKFIIKPWLKNDNPENNIIAWLISIFFGIVLAVACFLSVRCSAMLALTIPTLATARGRLFLYVILVNTIVNGPIMHIMGNVQAGGRLTICYKNNILGATTKNTSGKENFVATVANMLSSITNSTSHGSESFQQIMNEALTELEKQNMKAPYTGHDQSTFNELKSANDSNDAKWRGSHKTKGLPKMGGLLVKLATSAKGVISGNESISIGDVMEQFIELTKEFCDLAKFGKIAFPIMESVKKVLKVIKKVKKTIKSIMDVVFIVIPLVKKLPYLGMLFMFSGGYFYVCKYLANDSHDNDRIDYNLKRSWLEGNNHIAENHTPYANSNGPHPPLLTKIVPLRRWEKDIWLSRWKKAPSGAEAKKMLTGGIPIIGATIGFVFLFVIDIWIYETMQRLVELIEKSMDDDPIEMFEEAHETKDSNGNPLCGHNQEKFVKDIISGMHNLLSNNCTLEITTTWHGGYELALFMLVITWISLIMQAYAKRVSPLICGWFFPERALERAIYLYQRITLGRASRDDDKARIVREVMAERVHYKVYSENWVSKLLSICFTSMLDLCPLCNQKFGSHGKTNVYMAPDLPNVTICGNCNINETDVIQRNTVQGTQTVQVLAVVKHD